MATGAYQPPPQNITSQEEIDEFMKTRDEERKELQANLKNMDVTGDEKLSLAGKNIGSS